MTNQEALKIIRDLETIASTHLGIETLSTQGRDSLDFHEVGVASLRAALLAAYELGKSSKSSK